MQDNFLKKIDKKSKEILIRKGKHCGNLGNPDDYYEKMQMTTKRRPTLADAINK